MDLHTPYLKTIRRVYPDLQITSTRLNTRGQNNVILIVNDRYVFRFPKYAHLIVSLKVEADILLASRACLPLPVPNPEFIHLDGQPVGAAFLGYMLIPGEPLYRETFQKIKDEDTLNTLAEQIAVFLLALHSIPVGKVFHQELPTYETRQEYEEMYERVQRKLFAFMRTDAQQWAAHHFEAFLDEASNFSVPPVLRHGDFGASNLLFDSSSQRISGVIDFSSAGLGDSAVDFAGLLSSYGESFLLRCMRFYPQLKSLLPRVHFYRGIFALEEALFGIENGDKEAFQAGIAQFI